MKKHIKGIAAVFLCCALLLADFLYWTVSFSLGPKLPREAVTKVQLWYYDEYFDSHELSVEGDALEALVSAVKTERVTKRPSFRTMSDPYFYLLLYCGDGYPSALTIVENGDISLDTEIVSDRRQYFDSGEELYQALLALRK